MSINNIALPKIKFVSSVKPLLPGFLPGMICGTLSSLCPIFIVIMGASLVLHEMGQKAMHPGMTAPVICVILFGMALAGGILYYVKKTCARRVGTALLVSVGEKMYGADAALSAAIDMLTILTMVIYVGHYHILSGLFALASCLIVAVAIPCFTDRFHGRKEEEVQVGIQDLKGFVQDTLEGMDEIRQYHQKKTRQQQMSDRSKHIVFLEKKLSNAKAEGASYRNLAVLLLTFGMMFLNMYLYEKGGMDFAGGVLSTIAMMGMLRPILY